MKLNQTDMDGIIDNYWPKTGSRASLYKMMQESAGLAIERLLESEATQEPVASYQLSAPICQGNLTQCSVCNNNTSKCIGILKQPSKEP